MLVFARVKRKKGFPLNEEDAVVDDSRIFKIKTRGRKIDFDYYYYHYYYYFLSVDFDSWLNPHKSYRHNPLINSTAAMQWSITEFYFIVSLHSREVLSRIDFSGPLLAPLTVIQAETYRLSSLNLHPRPCSYFEEEEEEEATAAC